MTSTYVRHASGGIFVPSNASIDLPYSDGDDAEGYVARAVEQADDRTVHSLDLARAIVDWPSRYHLSAQRANLLRPIREIFTGTTVEVGAGCGAVTRYLGELGGRVIAVEGSRRRAEIAAARCADLSNVQVVWDRFERLSTNGAADAVTFVGVLEWAQKFVDAPDPIATLLDHAARLLRPDGWLVVAIENQLGLKYLAGWPEDHLGAGMYGINDLYSRTTPRTFGRAELLARLAAAGFGEAHVFVPLPDYKLPVSVVTPAGLAREDWRSAMADLAASSGVADAQAPVLPLFSLERAWPVVVRNGLLKDLANSFLVVARRDGTVPPPWSPDVLAAHYGSARQHAYMRETLIRDHGGSVTVDRRALDTAATPPQHAGLSHRIANEPFQSGRLWTATLALVLNQSGWGVEEVAEWARPWLRALCTAAGVARVDRRQLIPGDLLDATPFNWLVDEAGNGRFIDQEWQANGVLELGFVVFRALVWSLARFRSAASPAAHVPTTLVDLSAAICAALDLALEPSEVDAYCEREVEIQSAATGIDTGLTADTLRRLALHTRLSLEELAQAQIKAASLPGMHAELYEARRELTSSQASLAQAMAARANLQEALENALHTLDEERSAWDDARKAFAIERAALEERCRLITAQRDAALAEYHQGSLERDSLRGTLDAVLTSRSWRLTSPLRKLRSLLP